MEHNTGNVCRQPVIGIDASRANRPQKTGTEWYAYRLLLELADVIPPEYGVRLYVDRPLEGKLRSLADRWEERVLKWPPRRFWTQIRLSLEMRKDPPDLLFVPAHTLPVILPDTAVTTVHDVAFMDRRDAYSAASRAYHRWATRFAVRHAERIFTVSEFSRGEIVRHFGASRDRIIVTPLAADPFRYHRVDDRHVVERVRAQYGITGPYFLYVGRLEAKKNLNGLLQAFRAYRHMWPERSDTKLVLVGKPGYGYDSAFEGIDSRTTANVIEPGYVPQADMAALYSGAQAFLFPTWYEGFGLPVLEAFACGTPVIASRNTSISEVAGDAALLTDPSRPEDIARAMHRIVIDDVLREDLVARGEERVGQYSWKRTAHQTWEGMRPLLETKCD